ncbi:hypothetical protein [Undibacterium sp. CCC3.4]|nr:hypothetical protein [Undibacterium sp. CCC3.4]WPX43462.1 hypothetical protein RHM61_19155 [Undibacterium sp. CCC3.4]
MELPSYAYSQAQFRSNGIRTSIELFERSPAHVLAKNQFYAELAQLSAFLREQGAVPEIVLADVGLFGLRLFEGQDYYDETARALLYADGLTLFSRLVGQIVSADTPVQTGLGVCENLGREMTVCSNGIIINLTNNLTRLLGDELPVKAIDTLHAYIIEYLNQHELNSSKVMEIHRVNEMRNYLVDKMWGVPPITDAQFQIFTKEQKKACFNAIAASLTPAHIALAAADECLLVMRVGLAETLGETASPDEFNYTAFHDAVLVLRKMLALRYGELSLHAFFCFDEGEEVAHLRTDPSLIALDILDNQRRNGNLYESYLPQRVHEFYENGQRFQIYHYDMQLAWVEVATGPLAGIRDSLCFHYLEHFPVAELKNAPLLSMLKKCTADDMASSLLKTAPQNLALPLVPVFFQRVLARGVMASYLADKLAQWITLPPHTRVYLFECLLACAAAAEVATLLPHLKLLGPDSDEQMYLRTSLLNPDSEVFTMLSRHFLQQAQLHCANHREVFRALVGVDLFSHSLKTHTLTSVLQVGVSADRISQFLAFMMQLVDRALLSPAGLIAVLTGKNHEGNTSLVMAACLRHSEQFSVILRVLTAATQRRLVLPSEMLGLLAARDRRQHWSVLCWAMSHGDTAMVRELVVGVLEGAGKQYIFDQNTAQEVLLGSPPGALNLALSHGHAETLCVYADLLFEGQQRGHLSPHGLRRILMHGVTKDVFAATETAMDVYISVRDAPEHSPSQRWDQDRQALTLRSDALTAALQGGFVDTLCSYLDLFVRAHELQLISRVGIEPWLRGKLQWALSPAVLDGFRSRPFLTLVQMVDAAYERNLLTISECHRLLGASETGSPALMRAISRPSFDGLFEFAYRLWKLDQRREEKRQAHALKLFYLPPTMRECHDWSYACSPAGLAHLQRDVRAVERIPREQRSEHLQRLQDKFRECRIGLLLTTDQHAAEKEKEWQQLRAQFLAL